MAGPFEPWKAISVVHLLSCYCGHINGTLGACLTEKQCNVLCRANMPHNQLFKNIKFKTNFFQQFLVLVIELAKNFIFARNWIYSNHHFQFFSPFVPEDVLGFFLTNSKRPNYSTRKFFESRIFLSEDFRHNKIFEYCTIAISII